MTLKSPFRGVVIRYLFIIYYVLDIHQWLTLLCGYFLLKTIKKHSTALEFFTHKEFFTEHQNEVRLARPMLSASEKSTSYESRKTIRKLLKCP